MEEKIASTFSEMEKIERDVKEFLEPYVEDGDLLMMGFHEMLANAIEHGNKLNSGKMVTVRATVAEKYIKISIKDEGTGFLWKEQLEGELNLSTQNDRGRGVVLTKMCYDEVIYNEEGNKVMLIKERK